MSSEKIMDEIGMVGYTDMVVFRQDPLSGLPLRLLPDRGVADARRSGPGIAITVKDSLCAASPGILLHLKVPSRQLLGLLFHTPLRVFADYRCYPFVADEHVGPKGLGPSVQHG